MQTIDAEAEKITLAGTKKLDISDLPAQVPSDEPRFHFFRYDHEHEGQQLKSIGMTQERERGERGERSERPFSNFYLVMVYSCPDGSGNTKSAPVRQRMLYSSSKANIENILQSIGGKCDIKVEVNQSSEVAPDAIHNQLHPPKEEKKEV